MVNPETQVAASRPKIVGTGVFFTALFLTLGFWLGAVRGHSSFVPSSRTPEVGADRVRVDNGTGTFGWIRRRGRDPPNPAAPGRMFLADSAAKSPTDLAARRMIYWPPFLAIRSISMSIVGIMIPVPPSSVVDGIRLIDGFGSTSANRRSQARTKPR